MNDKRSISCIFVQNNNFLFQKLSLKVFYHLVYISEEIEKHSVEKALNYLNSTGGTWPTFDQNWNENEFDLEASLAAAALQDSFDFSGTVLGTFIRVSVERDLFQPRPQTSIRVSN